jgi:hypothetical protein
MLARMWHSALDTADNPRSLELVAYIDNDDPSYSKRKLRTSQVIFVRGPRKHNGKVNLSIKWNRCWKKATGDIFMHCGDDIVFRTKGWDTAIREAINARPGKICFAWCNDYSNESQRNEFGTHGFIHRNWTNVIGRFVPPYFVSDYNDTWFNDVAEKLGVRTYIHNHTIEHMHYSLGKSPMDNNTEERLKRHERDHPDLIYYSREKRIEREDEIEMLREFINEQTS